MHMFHPTITYLERIGQSFSLYSQRRHFVRQFLGLFHWMQVNKLSWIACAASRCPSFSNGLQEYK